MSGFKEGDQTVPDVTLPCERGSNAACTQCQALGRQRNTPENGDFPSVVTNGSDVYCVEKVLGKGYIGKVYQCHKKDTDQVVALKMMDEYKKYPCEREIKALKHLKQLNTDEVNMITFIDDFQFEDKHCLALEVLDTTLTGLMKRRRGTLEVYEVRAVAYQMLVALDALKKLGMTHADIKTDNVMLCNHESEPFRVKLIDFGFCVETPKLKEFRKLQTLGYRAPQVSLGLPLDESIDIWSLAITLIRVYIGKHLFPATTEYNYVRLLIKMFGMPEASVISEGSKAPSFFSYDEDQKTWRFNTPAEYSRETGIETEETGDISYGFNSLDDLYYPEVEEDPYEAEDLKLFIDFLKKILVWNSADRITPEEALRHSFITMEHLSGATNSQYVTSADGVMRPWTSKKTDVVAAECEETTTDSPGPHVLQSLDTDSETQETVSNIKTCREEESLPDCDELPKEKQKKKRFGRIRRFFSRIFKPFTSCRRPEETE